MTEPGRMTYEQAERTIERLKAANTDYVERLNCVGHMTARSNREVQKILGYTGSQDPSQIFVPPTTLATRVVNAEAEVERLKARLMDEFGINEQDIAETMPEPPQ